MPCGCCVRRANDRKERSGDPNEPGRRANHRESIIDPAFRQAFKTDRQKALARYSLTPRERNGLMQFDVQAIEIAVRTLQMSKALPTESMFW